MSKTTTTAEPSCTPNEIFSRNAAGLLRKSGMTQSELGNMLGVTQSCVSQILSGRENLTLDRAERVANCLGVELSVILKKTKVIA